MPGDSSVRLREILDEVGLTGEVTAVEISWPIIREIMKTAIENRQNIIVEGCYIPCNWRRDFDE